MKNRHASWDASRFSELDEARRAAITEEEALQAERNATSKSIGQMMAAGERTRPRPPRSASARSTTSWPPSPPSARPPIPSCTTSCCARRTCRPTPPPWAMTRTTTPRCAAGAPARLRGRGIQMKPHWDLGADLHMLEPERAVKLAASRFVLLRGQAARLERAIINFMADTHTSRGYTEWWCPAMAKRRHADRHRPAAQVRGRPVQNP